MIVLLPFCAIEIRYSWACLLKELLVLTPSMLKHCYTMQRHFGKATLPTVEDYPLGGTQVISRKTASEEGELLSTY